MNGFLVALLVWGLGGLANLLIDVPSLWNYDWSNGPPSYQDLVASPHRYLHNPLFCLLISSAVWLCLVTLTYGLCLGQIHLSQGGRMITEHIICGLVLYPEEGTNES